MGTARLSSLDASFLRVETPTAHMHVGWKGTFRPRADGGRPTLDELRRSIAARLRHAERFRQRVAFPPARLGEPFWVDDETFAIERHVTAMGCGDGPLAVERFHALADRFFSEPLPRDRALWAIELAPELEDGTVGLVMKVHHAMVDGRSAVELALLLLDATPDAIAPPEVERWVPRPAPTPARMALDVLGDAGGESLRAVRGAARGLRSTGRIADTLRRTALAVGEDLMRPAPASYVNCDIGPRRTLVAHTTAIAPLLTAKAALPGATLNDAALAVVAGGLRAFALRHGREPEPLKVMVPVSTRAPEEAADLGNRISFVFVELPVHLARPAARLKAVREATARFKRDGRATGGETLLSALGLLPEPLRNPAAKLAAHPRVYNLTVSNVPGPRFPVYLLGCELVAAAPVIPLPDRHALAIGVFTYRDTITFSAYADPVALPEVAALPAYVDAAIAEVGGLGVRTTIRAVA